MTNLNTYFTLMNGNRIPPVGFGTDRTFIYIRKNIVKGFIELWEDIIKHNRYHLKRDFTLYKILRNSQSFGCPLIDTASAYGQSERVLGTAVKHMDREKMYIVTKLSNREQLSGNVESALRRSLRKLRIDKVDLYLLHWPQKGTYIDCWKQMEEVYKKGLAGAIGVCNFKEHHFEELRKTAEIMPMVNQIECHPLFNQENMVHFCKENKIQMMAYTPTGRMDERIVNNKLLQELSLKYKRSIAQIIIRWHYQRGVIPIINTTNVMHLTENMDVFDFHLSQKDMEQIKEINIDCRLRYDPDTVDFTKC